MKTKFRCLIVFAFLLVLLSGCGCFQQQMKGETPPPPAPLPQVAAPEVKPVLPVQPPPPAVITPKPVVALKDINFDFDKYNIRPGDAEILRQNVAWFGANPGKALRIEGNCDERGTVEYNLVLGQRRSDAARDFLINLGVAANLITTVSYGKEKPLCVEHNEQCWVKNRRAHFVPIE